MGRKKRSITWECILKFEYDCKPVVNEGHLGHWEEEWGMAMLRFVSENAGFLLLLLTQFFSMVRL